MQSASYPANYRICPNLKQNEATSTNIETLEDIHFIQHWQWTPIYVYTSIVQLALVVSKCPPYISTTIIFMFALQLKTYTEMKLRTNPSRNKQFRSIRMRF